MKRIEYSVSYTTNGEEVQDIMNSLEAILVIAIAKLSKRIEISEIRRCEFCE